jgi:hypothetical protein
MVLALREEACVIASLMITMPVLITSVFLYPCCNPPKHLFVYHL